MWERELHWCHKSDCPYTQYGKNFMDHSGGPGSATEHAANSTARQFRDVIVGSVKNILVHYKTMAGQIVIWQHCNTTQAVVSYELRTISRPDSGFCCVHTCYTCQIAVNNLFGSRRLNKTLLKVFMMELAAWTLLNVQFQPTFTFSRSAPAGNVYLGGAMCVWKQLWSQGVT